MPTEFKAAEDDSNTEGAHDAGRREILCYAGGGIEKGMTGHFLDILQTLLVIALGMSPVFLGLLLSIKTVWAALCDPIVAHTSDNIQTRWGRRHPFILVGSIARTIALVAMVAFFPKSPEITPNSTLDIRNRESISEPAGTPAPPHGTHVPFLSAARQSVSSFVTADSDYKKKVGWYVLACSLVFTTLGSITGIPYYALGLELCRSYDGRTRLVTVGSLVDKTISFLSPWILPFCLLPLFHTFLDGLLWYGLLAMAIGIPASIIMVKNTRERPLPRVNRKTAPPLLESIWALTKNIHFLKILLLYQFFGYAIGIFAQIEIFLNIYWVYSGDALAGTALNGYISNFATVLTFLALPLATWGCRRFQKHRALRFAVVWMAMGTALRWILITPEHPFLQLLLPIFFSIGISSFYLILSTMMADVSDIEELRTGLRRDATFGAVMSFFMKTIGALQPVVAGAVLVGSGFDISLGANQTAETFKTMRILLSFCPTALLLLGLLILWRYPLTREHMAGVKLRLGEKRKAAAHRVIM